jgi:5-methylcytosine-specific restriction endonuclease McrA
MQAPAFDNQLEAKWRAQKHAMYVATYHAIKPSMEAEYRTYLASPEWSAIRAAIFQRAQGTCECCESFPATQVHHLTYERIGHEELSDLMAVCSFCHGVIHGKLAL